MPIGNWPGENEEQHKQEPLELAFDRANLPGFRPCAGLRQVAEQIPKCKHQEYSMNATSEPDRLLIVRNDRVGDLMLTMPTFEYVRRAYPSSHISVLAGQRTSTLLRRNAFLDQVLVDDPSSSAWQLAKRLRDQQFDAALVVNAKTRNYLAVWMAGIPTRVTWARRPVGWLLGNRHVTLRRSHPPVHESEFALAFARTLRSDPSIEVSAPELHLDPEVVTRVRTRIRADVGTTGPLLGVHPGNYNSAWNWPADRYFQLISRLAQHAPVVVTGGPGEEGLLNQLEENLPRNLAHRAVFYRNFDLDELCAALSLIDSLTVSNTGPMHLASGLGTPVVALFSSQLSQCPAKWAPLGQSNTVLQAPLRPDDELSPEKEHEYMCRISLEDVVQANLRTIHVPALQLPRCA